MVVLKKIKGSTLMETLVASVLIVVVFMIASMILNNLFSNSIKNSTHAINTHFNELEYLYLNQELTLPYNDDFKSWEITIKKVVQNQKRIILFDALNSITDKSIERVLYE